MKDHERACMYLGISCAGDSMGWGIACAPDRTGHAMAFGWEAKHNRQVIRPDCQPHEGPQVAQQVLLIPFNAAQPGPLG